MAQQVPQARAKVGGHAGGTEAGIHGAARSIALQRPPEDLGCSCTAFISGEINSLKQIASRPAMHEAGPVSVEANSATASLPAP